MHSGSYLWITLYWDPFLNRNTNAAHQFVSTKATTSDKWQRIKWPTSDTIYQYGNGNKIALQNANNIAPFPSAAWNQVRPASVIFTTKCDQLVSRDTFQLHRYRSNPLGAKGNTWLVYDQRSVSVRRIKQTAQTTAVPNNTTQSSETNGLQKSTTDDIETVRSSGLVTWLAQPSWVMGTNCASNWPLTAIYLR